MSNNQRIKVWGMEAVRAQANGKWNTGDLGGLICGPVPGGDLPALVNEVDGQGADDEDTQAGNEHVVDGAEMLHLHQLAAGTGA